MEQSSDGCTAVSGLAEIAPEEQSGTTSPVSMTDSSYGSELDLGEQTTKTLRTVEKVPAPASELNKPASYYASLLATASLKLMSLSTRVVVPSSENKQLQLRIALHSGPCSAGVVGLPTSTGATRIPHYKLFGPSQFSLY